MSLHVHLDPLGGMAGDMFIAAILDARPDLQQAVEQVWFPVVHSNVSGSYDYKGLSDLALNCMFQRVSEHTLLEFDGDYISRDIEGDALATL